MLIELQDLGKSFGEHEVLKHVTASVERGDRIGIIGANGTGKTTLLRVLCGESLPDAGDAAFAAGATCGYLEQTGHLDPEKDVYETMRLAFQPALDAMAELETLQKQLAADHHNTAITDKITACNAVIDAMDAYNMDTQIKKVLNGMGFPADTWKKKAGVLSGGEQTRLRLARLLLERPDILILDEPTNHLDQDAREIIKKYLASKKGFILVSHDRDLLDACIDHVLVLNRASIEVQSGNFSSWWENKEKADHFARMEHEKRVKEIGKLKAAADCSSRWAEKNENTKIGYDPAKEHDRSISTRSYIGAKTKKMQSRVKAYEERMDREIEKKEGLLKDIETVKDLKIMPLSHYKERLIECRDFSLKYRDGKENVITGLNFELKQGDRVFLKGKNGCGKSSLIKYILTQNLQNSSNGGIEKRKITMSGCENLSGENIMATGTCSIASNLVISYINQDTSHLSGTLKEFAKKQEIDEPMLLSMLRSLDLDREQFVKNMEEFSEGQKKKVLIAASLLTPAHLYLWDEPLNYIDVFSRMQIEKLIAQFQPTMLIVEHDARFARKLATKVVEL